MRSRAGASWGLRLPDSEPAWAEMVLSAHTAGRAGLGVRHLCWGHGTSQVPPHRSPPAALRHQLCFYLLLPHVGDEPSSVLVPGFQVTRGNETLYLLNVQNEFVCSKIQE